MSHPLVLLQKHGRTAILKFNSDKNLNALTESVGQTFYQHVQQLKQDPKLNAVILTGEGRAFSAGGDLNFLKDRLKTPYAENVDIMVNQ
jgi:enoyl-CoA hydratase/carnithine racemase